MESITWLASIVMQPHKNSAPTITRPSIPTFVAFILERLKHAGHQAFIVGGAVRNIFLQLPIVDWDITTSAQTKEIKTIFNDIRCFSLKHDTVTLVRSGRHFEVTTFKGQADCLEDDLARRDFTINAMALDPERIEILDPFEGRMDIRRETDQGSRGPANTVSRGPPSSFAGSAARNGVRLSNRGKDIGNPYPFGPLNT